VLPILVERGRTPRRIETVHPLVPATEKALFADVEDGLYYLTVMAANSGRTTYGEHISVSVTPLSEVPSASALPKMTGVAGQMLEQATSADAILGFGKRIDTVGWQEPYRFEARRGDHAILSLPRAGMEVAFDSNENNKFDEATDEVILRDELNDQLSPTVNQVTSLPYDGAYFIRGYQGSFVLLPHRYQTQNGRVLISVPQKAGDYVGIAEKNGQILRGELSLVVQPSEARRIEIKPTSEVVRGRPAEVSLQALDAFDNPVATDLEAKVTLQGVAQTVQLIGGIGHVQLQVPDKDRESTVTVRTVLGVDHGTLKPGAVSTAKGENKPTSAIANEIPSGEKSRSPISDSAAARPGKPAGLHVVPRRTAYGSLGRLRRMLR
jgi:hypothetical protein